MTRRICPSPPASLRTVLRRSLAAALLCCAAAAHAERPLQTEDAGVLDRGECQGQSAVAQLKDDGARVRNGYVQLGCGVLQGTQVQLAIGRTTGDGARSDDVVLNGKTALIPLTDERPGLAIAYSAVGARPRAPEQQGLRLVLGAVKAVYSAPFASNWVAHANLGWARDTEARSDSTLWNLALERTAIGPFDLLGEVFGTDHDAAWLNVGARWWVMPKTLWLDASYGVQTRGSRPRLATVGVSFFF